MSPHCAWSSAVAKHLSLYSWITKTNVVGRQRQLIEQGTKIKIYSIYLIFFKFCRGSSVKFTMDLICWEFQHFLFWFQILFFSFSCVSIPYTVSFNPNIQQHPDTCHSFFRKWFISSWDHLREVPWNQTPSLWNKMPGLVNVYRVLTPFFANAWELKTYSDLQPFLETS